MAHLLADLVGTLKRIEEILCRLMSKRALMALSASANERRYVVTVAGGTPTECDERTLMVSWARVPNLALRVGALKVEESSTF